MYKIDTSPGPRVDKMDALLRESLRRAMLARCISPQELADGLAERCGRKLDVALVRAWTASSRHRWRLPAELVPLICEILGDDSIQRLVLSDKLREALELGEKAPRVAELLRDALKQRQGRSKR